MSSSLDRAMSVEEASARAIMEMLEMVKNKKKILTDLSEEEINMLTLLDTMGKRLKVKEINSFVGNFCEYRVSRDRLGRKEVAGMVTASGFAVEEKGKVRSLKKMFGGFG